MLRWPIIFTKRISVRGYILLTLLNLFSGNLAHDYMMSARKRKGLSTDEQIVVSGEKQRTLKKNK